MSFLGGRKKDKGFSSKNKIQHYEDGTESIVMMGRPFRVLHKITDGPNRRSGRWKEGQRETNVYLVENSSRLADFPRHLALKRSIYPVDQVAEAHKEIEILSRIKDKNVVRVLHSEVTRSEGRLGVSIAMEFCGSNIARRLRGGVGFGAATSMTEGEICHVLIAVTSAVGYLHSQQPPIAHRDIRPENILINSNHIGPAMYKLCNFRNASTDAYHCMNREEASMAITDIEQHTNAGFRAPEMADPWSKRRISEKVDMWSIGVLLYLMMYHKLPFEPTNMALAGNPQVRYPAGSEGRFTGSFRVVLEHLLDPDPNSRWDVFALTSFLRFDDDLSRHLGTFCFSKTEWPEGWEEQDVKVVNRTAPTKNPPITYGNSGGPAKTKAKESLKERGDTATVSRGPGVTAEVGDDAVQAAMMVLGGEDDANDPEAALHREQIIREQEEAWEQAKAAARACQGNPSSPATVPTAPISPHDDAASCAVEENKNVLDDLFAGPVEVAPVVPPPLQPASGTALNTDDLFAAPPPMQPQPHLPAGWPVAGGAPAMYMAPPTAAPTPFWGDGAHTAFPMTGTAPVWPQVPVYGGGPTGPVQQAFDFMSPAPGQSVSAPTAAPPPQQQPTKRKDPFEDLFS